MLSQKNTDITINKIILDNKYAPDNSISVLSKDFDSFLTNYNSKKLFTFGNQEFLPQSLINKAPEYLVKPSVISSIIGDTLLEASKAKVVIVPLLTNYNLSFYDNTIREVDLKELIKSLNTDSLKVYQFQTKDLKLFLEWAITFYYFNSERSVINIEKSGSVNGILYLVGNSVDARYNSAGCYLITIDNYWGPNQLKANLQLISSDTMDFGYPSIAYCGNGLGDNSAMISLSHVSPRSFPGNSLVYVDRNLNISTSAIMKQGESNILLIGDSVERWGDYGGIQLKYNEPGKVYYNGSFGFNNDNRTWVGISKNTDSKLSNKEQIANTNDVSVYPLPAKEYMTVDFSLEEKSVLNFYIIDMQGKETLLLTDRAKAGLNRFTFNALNLTNGYYQLLIKDGEKTIISKKIVITH
jgi:hypothetical protein